MLDGLVQIAGSCPFCMFLFCLFSFIQHPSHPILHGLLYILLIEYSAYRMFSFSYSQILHGFGGIGATERQGLRFKFPPPPRLLHDV